MRARAGDSGWGRFGLGIVEDSIGVAGHHVVLFQCQADAAAEFADGGVLLGRQRLEDYGEDEFAAFDGVYAEDLRIGYE